MAIPVIASSTSNTTEGTASSITLTKPSGVEIGDLLLLLVGNENSAASEGFDTLTGWTLEFNFGNATSDCYLGLYSRVSTGDSLEDAPVVPFLASDDGHGWYLRVTGVNATDPLRVVGSEQIAVDSTITITALTTDTNTYSLAISTMSFDGSDAMPFVESGTGWTLGDDIDSPLSSNSGNASSGAYSTKGISTASTSTGTSIITGDGTSDGIAATMFIVAGAEGGTEYFGSATLEAGSTVSAESFIEYGGAASVSGISTVSAESFIEYFGASALSGISTITAAGFITLSGAASLAASSTVLAHQSIIYKMDSFSSGSEYFGSATLSGISTVSGESFITYDGKADLSGVSTVSAESFIEYDGKADLSGISTVSAESLIEHSGSASLSGVSTVSAESLIEYSGIASLSGISTVSANGYLTLVGASTLSGISTVSADGLIEYFGSASLSGISTVTAEGYLTGTHYGSATLSGVSTVGAESFIEYVGSATLSGISTVTAEGYIAGDVFGAIDLSSSTTCGISSKADRRGSLDISSTTSFDLVAGNVFGAIGLTSSTAFALRSYSSIVYDMQDYLQDAKMDWTTNTTMSIAASCDMAGAIDIESDTDIGIRSYNYIIYDMDSFIVSGAEIGINATSTMAMSATNSIHAQMSISSSTDLTATAFVVTNRGDVSTGQEIILYEEIDIILEEYNDNIYLAVEADIKIIEKGVS